MSNEFLENLENQSEDFDHKNYVGLLIGVPNGEQYGFPKVYDGSEKNIYDWIEKQGYPKKYFDHPNFMLNVSPNTPTKTISVNIENGEKNAV